MVFTDFLQTAKVFSTNFNMQNFKLFLAKPQKFSLHLFMSEPSKSQAFLPRKFYHLQYMKFVFIS